MFVIIPYHADSDTREFPWGTVGMVAANLLVALLGGFAGRGAGSFVDSWILEFGTLNPLTWITSAFVHFDWFHVIFNVIFLWAFGFVVEGYLGWRRFLALYFSLVLADGAITQIFMLGADGGGSAGASGAVYGLMAIAALWAPRNILKVFVWIAVIIRKDAEISVWRFCAIYIGLELLAAALTGFHMSSAMLHLIGAGCGVAAAVICLNKGWVDTEGWDYLALQRHGEPRRRSEVVVEEAVPKSVSTLVGVRNALADEEPMRADAIYRAAPAEFRLPLDDLKTLVHDLLRAGRPELAVPHMEEWLELDPDPAVRLRLAEALIGRGQPSRALDQLALLDRAALDEAQRSRLASLRSRAEERRASGGLELE